MLRNVTFDTTNFRRLVPENLFPTPVPDAALMGRCNQYCLRALEQEFGRDLAEAVVD